MQNNRQNRSFRCTVMTVLALFAAGEVFANIASAKPYGKNSKTSSRALRSGAAFPQMKNISGQDVDMSADSYEYIGSNLVAKGHVVIQLKGLQITAKSAVVNLVSKDFEASGDVVLSSRTVSNRQLSSEEYERYLEDPAVQVSVIGITTAPDGRQAIHASVRYNNAYLEAERVSGSLLSGSFQFRKFALKANHMFFRGEYAERTSDGKLKLYRTKLSTCEYMLDDNAHYSFSSKKIVMIPREDKRALEHVGGDQGEQTLLAYNNLLRIWDVPVLWLPILYKPRELSLFGIRFEYGSRSEWGNYIRTTKEFEILEEEALIRAGVMVDYYEDRGMGFGMTADVFTDNSKTEFFGYYVNDRNPYSFWDDNRNKPKKGYTRDQWLSRYSRYKIPRNRYEFRLSNLTHLTPRLDFRGQIDVISDYNFLKDFFEKRYDRDVQPPSFAAVEYQGDRYSVTVGADFKVNRFDSAVNRLPELRLDLPRQELFKNIYYQGETTAGYYQMSWRKFDFDREENPFVDYRKLLRAAGRKDLAQKLARFGGNKTAINRYLKNRYPKDFKAYFEGPDNYSAFRFDTLHGFYYPMKFFGALNLIPRAMARFTTYSKSSKTKMNMDDLFTLFNASRLDSWPNYMTKVKNYDDDGSAKYRFAFELGLEGNVKLHRTWQEPKNAFWQIDGLRHVMVPYFNLVYIPRPTENYKRLYYFDDVDLIDREAFVRLGVQNRLQTRRNGAMYQWLSMENYWDFHFETRDGYNHIGDFGTRFSFTPTEELSFNTSLLIDAGGNSDHKAKLYHGAERTGQRGISSNLINSFNVSVDYSPAKDWRFRLGYYYMDEYTQRSIMSMGSTLTQINSTSRYKYMFEREQTIAGSVMFPTMIDKRLKGIFSCSYNIDENIVDKISLVLRRDFHCWYFAAGIGCSNDRNERGKLEWDYEFSFTLGLSAMPFAAYTAKVDGN